MHKTRIVVIITLLVPALLAVFMYYCTRHHYSKLPVLGEKILDSKGDTIFHTIGNFSGQNQHSEVFGTDSLKGKIHIADFIFTTCPGICKQMSKSMLRLQTNVLVYGDVKLISYSIDPKTDTPPVLLKYAENLKAQRSVWNFLTGNQDSIFHLAVKGYLVPVVFEEGKGDLGFTHSEFLVLVDKDLRVRGFYNGLENKELDKLLDEIKVLRYEYEGNK